MLDIARLWARIVGLGVAIAAAVVATQLLTLGFETSPLITTTTLGTVTDWIRRPPQPGVGILATIAVVFAAITALLGGLWPRRGHTAIVTRRRDGWTRIDRKSLQDAIERRLETIDRRSDVKATVHRSGKVDLDITSIDVTANGPGAKAREALEDLCDQRHLPCKAGAITITSRRPTTNRRHRIQ